MVQFLIPGVDKPAEWIVLITIQNV